MSIQEKRRAAFEAWAAQNAGRLVKDEDGDYLDDFVHGAWLGWNAALDSVVIELPSINLAGPRHDRYMAMDYQDVLTAIESAGLRVKV